MKKWLGVLLFICVSTVTAGEVDWCKYYYKVYKDCYFIGMATPVPCDKAATLYLWVYIEEMCSTYPLLCKVLFQLCENACLKWRGWMQYSCHEWIIYRNVSGCSTVYPLTEKYVSYPQLTTRSRFRKCADGFEPLMSYEEFKRCVCTTRYKGD